MATANHIKALLKSFNQKDSEQFYNVALQIAALEERKGHTRLATDIRKLVDTTDVTPQKISDIPRIKRISAAEQRKKSANLEDLLHLTPSDVRLNQMVLDGPGEDALNRVIHEYRQKEELSKYGLSPRRKLLLKGAPGTGKTLTAKVIAHELKLPLYTLQFDALISRYLGETAGKLRAVFDQISSSRAVYLFDEFDAIGSNRSNENEVGEIRRVLNSFLQFFEDDSSESIIVCATNYPEMLDKALFRRFDDIIEFRLPNKEQITEFIKNKLFLFDTGLLDFFEIESKLGLVSYAELGKICEDAAKYAVLHKNRVIETRDILFAAELRADTSLK